MAKDKEKVEMGVCDVTFSGIAMGYTAGGVTVAYTTDTIDKIVDQEDAPIGRYIRTQNFTAEVPLAEEDFEILQWVLPNATYIQDGTKEALVLSGAAGSALDDMAAILELNPVEGDDNNKLTFLYAIPSPNISFNYNKDDVRVFTITFTATVDTLGWVIMGDTTASGITLP